MDRNKGLMLVFSTAIISGGSIFINKFGVSGIDSGIFTFAKNILVALFLFSLIFATTKLNEFVQLKKEEWLKLILIGLVGGSIPFLLFFRGLQLTTGTSAALIHKTLFVFVTLFAVIFLKEKLNKKVFIAVALLLGGNYLLLRPQWTFSTGDLLVLAATLFWAAENTLSKYTLRDLSGSMVAFGRMFFGSIFILAYLSVVGKVQLLSSINASQIIWITISSFMLFMYVFTWYNGLKYVPASLATAILLLGSPITTILNFATGSTVTLTQVVGSFLLLGGIAVFIYSTEKIKLFEAWTKKTEH